VLGQIDGIMAGVIGGELFYEFALYATGFNSELDSILMLASSLTPWQDSMAECQSDFNS
jgi:hypothetical protein